MTSTHSKLGNIKAVLFDMDGLLLDSEIVYTIVVNEILKPYGKEQTWEIKSRLMGKPEREAVITLLSSLWPPTGSNSLFSSDCPFTIESFLSQRNLNLDEAFGKVDAMPGAERLVQHLYKHNVPICVATGSKLRNFRIKSKPHDGIFKPFGDRIICGDDERINRGKPFPDIFLLAAREGLGLEEMKDQVREMGEKFDGTFKGGEGDILVFEDGLPGVEAGIKAGMKVVWVPDENLLKLHPTSEAHQTLKSLNDFKPELWGLPPFDN